MFSFRSKVRYSEVASDGKLSLYAAIHYMQDASFLQSEELSVGIPFLKERNRGWILASWQIEVVRRPAYNEEVTVETWPTGFRSMYGYRNFVIRGEDGKEAIRAYTIWIYMNTETGRPTRVEPELISHYQVEPALDMEEESRKLSMPQSGIKLEPIPVRPSMIDTNGHVNNGQYYLISSDWLYRDGQIIRIRIEYKKAAMPGDIMYPVAEQKEYETTVALCDSEGNAYAIVKAMRECND